MACVHLTLPNGATAIVCGVRRQRRRCSMCRQRWAAVECDWCDKPLCVECATHLTPDIDGCGEHVYEVREREAIRAAD
jgi:hypothetical protein